jgi:uncharacterized membrane protein YqjE
MNTLQTSQLVIVLQQAVGPVVLISGVGLLLLTMTNRLGRIVDRSRALAQQARAATGEEQETVRAQLRILGQRAELVRWAILLAGFCVLFIALLVISLFVTALFGVEAAWLIAGFFIVSLLCLIASLVMFIRDINKSLNATALEVGEDWKRG